MEGHVSVGKALRACGIDTVFGLLGDANLRHVAAFIDGGGNFVPAVGEGGSVSMAHGYAHSTRTVGVCTVTHGPAVTNTVTALTEAVRAGSPLLVLTGDPPGASIHSQEIDLQKVAALTGAQYWKVRNADDIPADIEYLIQRAAVVREPTLVNIPLDVQNNSVAPGSNRSRGVLNCVAPSPSLDDLDRALGIIASSRRPVIVAGRGAALSEARDDLVALAEVTGAWLGTTLQAKDMFDGHPRNIGIVGGLAGEAALEVIAKADCIVSFGAGMNMKTTAEGSLLSGKAVVRCDINAERILRYQGADAFLLGDVGDVARQLCEALEGVQEDVPGGTPVDAAEAKSQNVNRSDLVTAPGTVDMRHAMVRLDELLPVERVVVTDTGRFTRAAWRYLRVGNPLDFLYTTNFGSIGLGLATAIGAAVGAVPRLTVGVLGDGGAMMNLMEFTSAVRADTPLLIVILNDGSYGAEYSRLEAFGMDPELSLQAWPEFADMASAMGGRGYTVRSLGDLENAVQSFLQSPRPTIVDVKCDPSVDWYQQY